MDRVITQAEFADLVGISEAAVSQSKTAGIIASGATGLAWLRAYCQRLRDQAAGRMGDETGGLDLVQERAALAREQRIGQAMKNAVARGDYAPIGALADVLGMAASAVVDRFDQLDGSLRKACPDLPEDARDTVLQVIASARNEWLRATASLVADQVQAMADTAAETDADDALLAALDDEEETL